MQARGPPAACAAVWTSHLKHLLFLYPRKMHSSGGGEKRRDGWRDGATWTIWKEGLNLQLRSGERDHVAGSLFTWH